jgi:ABC-type multidrug transport system permease subunit
MTVFDLYGGFVLKEQLEKGRMYSPAILVGVNNVYYERDSPFAFWVCIVIYIVCLLIGLVIVALVLRELFEEEKRRRAVKKCGES